MTKRATHTKGNDNSHLPSGQSYADTNYIRRNHTLIVDLPEPEKEWGVRDLKRWGGDYPDLTDGIRRLKTKNIIQEVRTEYRKNEGDYVEIYETDRVAYEKAHEYVEKIDTLPCCPEGTGFKNVGSDGDEPPYACSACGARHTREEILESGVLS